ncbi:MAG: NUDIX domain-containing protein [Bacteroidota bacterium]
MSHILKDVIRNLSVDCVIFGFENNSLEILLIKRARKPSVGKWALPGGFIKKEELVDDAANRILQETTGIRNIYMEEVAIFDKVDRYPKWRVFTLGYFALISPEKYFISTGVDTKEVKWFKIDELPKLPFDHEEILNTSLEKLRTRVRYRPIGFELLPKKFTLPQLQKLYEVVLGKKLDKRNFRKKISGMNLLINTNEIDIKNKRKAALYMFDKKNYNRLKREGFIFEL